MYAVTESSLRRPLLDRGEPPVASDRLVHVRVQVREHAVRAPVGLDPFLDQREQVRPERLGASGAASSRSRS
jgi:hypothetical protein